jgi:hypothetical protein
MRFHVNSALSLSFNTASFGVLTPRCNHSRTLVTVSVCVTELRTSTSSWVNPPGSRSCFRKAHRPKTDASYSPSASTSTEWRTPSKSRKDTVQAAMWRSLAFSVIFANRTMCHQRHIKRVAKRAQCFHMPPQEISECWGITKATCPALFSPSQNSST